MAKKKPKAAPKKAAPKYHLNCSRCGDYFTANRKHAQFCSPKCRKHSSRHSVTLFATK